MQKTRVKTVGTLLKSIVLLVMFSSCQKEITRDIATGDTTLKPWITGNSRGTIPAGAQAVYNGEEAEMQGTLKISGIMADGITISSTAATEAFDEPLSYLEVLNIAKLFIVA